MAAQDIEMQDAIVAAETMNETPATDLTPILNTKMQQLGIGEDNKKSVPLSIGRLKVACDFGGSKSTIVWGWASNSIPIVYCSDQVDSLKDTTNNDRIPSVAAVISSTQHDYSAHLELVFGSAAAMLQAEKDEELPVKIEMMKLDLLKMEFLDSNSSSCDELGWSIQDTKLTALTVICEQSASKVCIEDPLTGVHNLHTILSSTCITREYLRYLLQNLKAAIAARYNLTFQGVEDLFNQYADVAMSLPAIADEDSRLAFRKVLTEACFPAATLILNEAKSATLYHVWDRVESFSGIRNFKEHLYVLDVGALTWDAYLLTVIYDAPKVELQGRAKPVGGFSGSQSWNYLFSRHVEHVLEDNISSMSNLFPDFGDNLDMSRRVLVSAIEPVKEIFSMNNVTTEYKIEPELYGTQMDDVEYDQFSTCESELYVQASLLNDVSENWCRPMINHVREHIMTIRCTVPATLLEPGSKIVVGLKGWGSLPPFVLEQFKIGLSTLKNVEVTRLETKTNSVVARGIYLTLLDEDIGRDF